MNFIEVNENNKVISFLLDEVPGATINVEGIIIPEKPFDGKEYELFFINNLFQWIALSEEQIYEEEYSNLNYNDSIIVDRLMAEIAKMQGDLQKEAIDAYTLELIAEGTL